MADYKAFVKWLGNLEDELKEKIGEVVEDITEATCDEAKKLSPVDTSALKNSIDTMYKNDKLTGYVYTNIHYSIYQEFGTRFIPAREYMHDAFYKYYDKFIDELKNLM